MNKAFHLLRFEEKLAILQVISELSAFSLHNLSKKRRIIEKVRRLCEISPSIEEPRLSDPEAIFKLIKHKDIKDYLIYFLYSIDKLEKRIPADPEQTVYLARILNSLQH